MIVEFLILGLLNKSTDKIKKVIEIMKKKGISQIPVKKGVLVCGIISEGHILQAMISNQNEIKDLKVKDVMNDAPPIVALKTGIKTLTELLKNYAIVLVADEGEVKGIISKVDLLGRI